jgi:hypothetical protein
MDLRLRALRREVMAPRRPSSSFGLIAVSTLAMVFAVSSSLLLFSAHRHHVRHARPAYLKTHPRPPAVRAPAPDLPAPRSPPAAASTTSRAPVPAPAACKGPVYRSLADGTTEIVFEQCPARPFANPPVAE